MSGHLYAVIFEQGTVKVGMSTQSDPSFRMRAAYVDARKWGIAVAKEFSISFDTDDLEFRELVLCGYCQQVSESVEGHEWFRFKSATEAEEKIKEFFAKIAANEYCAPQIRATYLLTKDQKDIQFDAAMVLIKGGIPAREAARRVGALPTAVLNRKAYIEWRDEKERAAQLLRHERVVVDFKQAWR